VLPSWPAPGKVEFPPPEPHPGKAATATTDEMETNNTHDRIDRIDNLPTKTSLAAYTELAMGDGRAQIEPSRGER
jgi:hypothetical protein